MVLQTMSEFFVAALVPQQVVVIGQTVVPVVPQSVSVVPTQMPRPHFSAVAQT